MRGRLILSRLLAVVAAGVIGACSAAVFADPEVTAPLKQELIRIELWEARVEGSIEACTKFVEDCQKPFTGRGQDLIASAVQSSKVSALETPFSAAYILPADASVQTIVLTKQETVKMDFKPTTVHGTCILELSYERKTNETAGQTQSRAQFNSRVKLEKGCPYAVAGVVSSSTSALPDGNPIERTSARVLILAEYDFLRR